MTQEERNEYLRRFLSRIESVAIHLVATYRPDLTPNDVVLESAIAFLERVEADPTFLHQPNSKIVRRCVLDGWNEVRRQRRLEKSQGKPGGMAELRPLYAADDTAIDPEEAAIAAEQAERVREIVAGLKPNYQAICYSLMSGSTKEGAMKAIGAKKQAWPHYHRHLQHAFVALAP